MSQALAETRRRRRARENPSPWAWAGIVGAAAGVLAGGIALAVVLSKPKAAPGPSPIPGPPAPQPPNPNTVVNPSSYTFAPGHRYTVTTMYATGLPPVTNAQATSAIQQLLPGMPVTLVQVSQPTPTTLVYVFDVGGGAAQTIPVPPPDALMTQVTITDNGLTANQ